MVLAATVAVVVKIPLNVFVWRLPAELVIVDVMFVVYDVVELSNSVTVVAPEAVPPTVMLLICAGNAKHSEVPADRFVLNVV